MSIEQAAPRKRRRRCPRCGETGALPVLFGLVVGLDPDENVILAGCEIPADPPRHLCRLCAHATGLL